MRPGGQSRAIADPPRLNDIVERQGVGDALRLDADRARRNQGHPALAKPARDTSVANNGCGRGIADNDSGALAAAMFELRQDGWIGEAKPGRRPSSGGTADLPQAPDRRPKRNRSLGGAQHQHSTSGSRRGQKESDSLHRTAV